MRVLIVGAGIAGHTLALCLLRRGDQALVVEKTPSLPAGGYMIDFFGSGYDACERLGLREELERIHYPVDRLVFLDARGRERFALPYSVLELLEHCPPGPPDLYFDVVSQLEVSRWSAGRVALAGDSCPCVSLLAGQGASLAVAGAYVLAEELAACGRDVPSALDRYESRLRPAIRDKRAASRRIANWFVPASSLRLAVRDVAVRLSLWPGVASLLRRGLAAGSVLTP
jgi:2-polyprenyl-6-methoxyphenol hydroxylase-like FAD-dependent oxidoreductase